MAKPSFAPSGRRLRPGLLAAALAACLAAAAAAATLTGVLVSPLGGPLANATLLLRLSQAAVQPGNFAVAPATVSCYTSSQGQIVGLPDLTTAPTGTAIAGSGTLPAGVYFIRLAFYSPAATALPSPELQLSLAAAGRLAINPPAQSPAGASGYNVYIGTGSGTETWQGAAALATAYAQTTRLDTGAAPAVTNNSACAVLFNDGLTPAYTYYSATLLDQGGNIVPGYPQNWYLGGATVDVSNLVPLASNPAVRFPMPVIANPATAVAQSVGSALQLNGYNVQGTGNLGPGYFPGYWSGGWPAAGTMLAQWTPNAAVTLRRLDANAQTAGVGGTAGASVTVSDGTSSCSFSGLLAASGHSASALAAGNCNFGAGVPLTVMLNGDDHVTAPQNITWTIELTGWQ